MKLLFALPGLHRFDRGAEVVFESIAQQIALRGEHEVTLVGIGRSAIADRAYRFVHVPAVSRDRFESWPKFPFLRHEFMYEELTFAPGLLRLAEVGHGRRHDDVQLSLCQLGAPPAASRASARRMCS